MELKGTVKPTCKRNFKITKLKGTLNSKRIIMKFKIDIKKKRTLKPKLKTHFRIGYLKEPYNRNVKGSFKSKLKSHFNIEI